jgi:predicted Zn-dependent peptidase
MTYQTTLLPNGLRVATDSMADVESLSLGLWVPVGTRHENNRQEGVAHLVEHMMFKGTKTRSARQLSTAIEKNGGMMNAHTSREETAYYVRILPEDTELGLTLLADMLFHSTCEPALLDRERDVIIQEIGRDHDTPEDHIYDEVNAVAFPGQPLGRSILGRAEVIAKLPRQSVLDYIKRHYHPRHMVLAAAGKIDHGKLCALASVHFPLMHGKKSQPLAVSSRYVGGRRHIKKDCEQTHLMLAYPAPGYAHKKASAEKDIYTASVLAMILGGGAASRLFLKIREERGLVYSIQAFLSPYEDVGLLGIAAGTDPAKLAKVLPLIRKELRAIADKGVSAAELKRAKASLRADMLMGQESVMRRTEQLATHWLRYGHVPDMAKALRRLEAVTVVDVRAMMKMMLRAKETCVTIGPGQIVA